MLIALPHKSVLTISGVDARTLLQGLITQNVDTITSTNAGYSALLTPQGKMVADFYMIGGTVLMCILDAERLPDLLKRLKMYKLRADMQLDASRSMAVAYAINDEPRPLNDWIVFPDPRSSRANGWWVIAPECDLSSHLTGSMAHYDAFRIPLGLTDGCRDWIAEKTLPLELWADHIGGVDFKKGCYVGQEVTARTHYRKAIKKRVMCVMSSPPTALPTQSSIKAGGIEIGTTWTTSGPVGLGLIRIADWEKQVNMSHPVLIGENPVVIDYPPYAVTEQGTPR
jgi:folate-binding protein YgfZ